MSPPEPLSVQVPPLNDWLPATETVPMSAQLQPNGQPGGGGVVEPTVTESRVNVLKAAELCELTATPPSSDTPRLASVTDEFAMGEKCTPSADVYAVSTLLTSVTCRYCGSVGAVAAPGLAAITAA